VGSNPTNVYGSVYSGAAISTGCSLYAHVLTDSSGAVVDQGNVLVYPTGQPWTTGGGFCFFGFAWNAVVCADGYEISGSACPSPAGTTDFLGSARSSYPCPSWSVATSTLAAYTPPEPNADSNVLATINGTACDPNGTSGLYGQLKINSTVVGRMRQTGTWTPVKDSAGYYHFKPGCYGWLDASLVAAADPLAQHVLVFDPGFYYFSGYFVPADRSGSSGPQTAGGICLGTSTMRVVGTDVLLEFASSTGPASLSTSSCSSFPAAATTSSGFGEDPGGPLVENGKTYGALSAPCDPSVNQQCPLASGSAWCPKTDRACNATLVWAPPGPPATSLSAINGSFFARGSNESSWLYGGVFWPGAASGGSGCSWTSNSSSTIVGQLVCMSLTLEGGSFFSGTGITYARTATSAAVSQAALTE